MKDFLFYGLLSIIVFIIVVNVGNENIFWWMIVCGALSLVVAGILWITTIIKWDKEYKRTNKEYDQYEKEAELALASEIEAVKGNSLKKELVKRKLVREYIEKNHPQASRCVNDSKFDDLYGWLGIFLGGGLILIIPLLCMLFILLWYFLPNIAKNNIPYSISPSYYVIANAVFAIVAVATTIWKRYYVLTIVAATLAAISIFGICTIGPKNILQPAYEMMIECVDSNFLHYYVYELAKATMFCSFLLVTMFNFCLMAYPFIKKWAIGL